eukprot:403333970
MLKLKNLATLSQSNRNLNPSPTQNNLIKENYLIDTNNEIQDEQQDDLYQQIMLGKGSIREDDGQYLKIEKISPKVPLTSRAGQKPYQNPQDVLSSQFSGCTQREKNILTTLELKSKSLTRDKKRMLKQMMKGHVQLSSTQPLHYNSNYEKQFLSQKIQDLYIDAYSSLIHKNIEKNRQDDNEVCKTFRDQKVLFKNKIQQILAKKQDNGQINHKDTTVGQESKVIELIQSQKREIISLANPKLKEELENEKKEKETKPTQILGKLLLELRNAKIQQQLNQPTAHKTGLQSLTSRTTVKDRSINLFSKLQVKFTEAIEQRLEEIQAQQLQRQQSLANNTLNRTLSQNERSRLFTQVVKVEHKYQVRDNLELEFFLDANDTKKRFFIRNMIDFDYEAFTAKPSGVIGHQFQYEINKSHDNQNLVGEQENISQCFWLKQNHNGDIPSNRENAYIFNMNKLDKIYLFGGHNGADLTDIYTFSLKSLSWKRIIPNLNSQGEIKAPYQLYGYGCAYWPRMKKLVVFGGARDIENTGKRRNKQCLRDIKMFDFNTKVWEEANVSGEDVRGKQNMACCLIEQQDGQDYFYFHGGFQNQKYFSDQAYKLNLLTLQWEQLFFTAQSKSPFLAYHSITPVQNENKSFRFYIFGGIDNQQHTPSNNLYLMQKASHQQNQYTLKLISDFKGMAPIPRSHHSVQLLNKRYLLVYGGRNDLLFKTCDQNDIYVNDISMFDTTTHEWICFRQFGYHPLGRWGASLGLIENQDDPSSSQIIVFGGTNLKGYVPNHTYKMLIGERQVKEQIKENKAKVKEFFQQIKTGLLRQTEQIKIQKQDSKNSMSKLN